MSTLGNQPPRRVATVLVAIVFLAVVSLGMVGAFG